MNSNTSPKSADLTAHWRVCGLLALLLIASLVVCHVWEAEWRVGTDEAQRVVIRSILYTVAIVLFPVTTLLRYILIRLDQTMPGDKPAAKRYLTTVIATTLLIESVAAFGPVMFALGDGYNTLYIFSGLGALGLFLQRPKMAEYLGIVEALAHKND